jgi:hypothetical protein
VRPACITAVAGEAINAAIITIAVTEKQLTGEGQLGSVRRGHPRPRRLRRRRNRRK